MSKLVFFIFARYARPFICAILASLITVSATVPAVAQQARPDDHTLCVLVPHFKDDYWLSVAFGLEQEARRHSVDLILIEAGGYQALQSQIAQIEACAKKKVDGILLGAVSSDHPDFLEAVARSAILTPIFGLVNELHSDALSGRIGVDWRDMGRSLGDHLADLFPKDGIRKKAVLISGPVESGWAGPLEAGLRTAMQESAVDIVQVYNADTGLKQQLDLVQAARLDHPELDLLIGSAPAIEAAMGVYRTPASSSRHPLLFSTYVNHSTKRGLLNGSIEAAPFDDPTLQGILAIRQAIAALDHQRPGADTGPPIRLLVHGDDNVLDVTVSPSGYFPELQ